MSTNRRDEALLQFLDEHELALPPRAIYENLRREGATFSYRTTVRRLDHLADLGLVESVLPNKGYYAITDRGRAYLAGELDDADLES